MHEKVMMTTPSGMSQGGEGDAAPFDIPVAPGVAGVIVLMHRDLRAGVRIVGPGSRMWAVRTTRPPHWCRVHHAVVVAWSDNGPEMPAGGSIAAEWQSVWEVRRTDDDVVIVVEFSTTGPPTSLPKYRLQR